VSGSMIQHTFKLLRASALALFCTNEALAADEPAYARLRQEMVEDQIAGRGVRNETVLAAMRKVPRHEFVPAPERARAYRDSPLPIGEGQTISQPYIVALMTELVRPDRSDRVLEIGTGSGYQAAVLAEIVDHVYTIELEPSLAASAAKVLSRLGYENVTVRAGDGYAGWKEHAPYDVVIVTAAPDHIPEPLLEQLAPGGVMVAPVGPIFATQQLRLIEKDENGKIGSRDVAAVRFVPLRREED
jgi:protein-L-isoaspartate(D-aspartate) O-methyltransferase